MRQKIATTQNEFSKSLNPHQRSNLWSALIVLVLLFLANPVFATPPSFVYQGQIIKSNGSPLSGTTTFTVQILSPGAEKCVLYEEKHILNLTGSEGVFSLSVGTGVRSGTRFEDVSNISNIFNNNATFNGLTTCLDGSSTSYSPPSTAERRKLRMSYNDGSGQVTIASDHNVLSVPYAWEAKTIDGLTPANFVQVSPLNNLTQSNLENLLTGTKYTNLVALANGSSTRYVQAGSGGASIPNLPSDPVTPAPGAIWFNSTTQKLMYFDTSAKEVGTGGVISLAEADIPTLVSPGKVDGSAIISGTIGGSTSFNSTGSIIADTISSSASSTKILDIYDSDNTNRVRIQTPATGTLSANYDLTLPTTDGNSGEVLTTNGAGVLSWTVSGGITSVVAGTGLTGGATSGAATLAIDYGTGSNQVQQNMDIPHCLSNQKLEMTAGPTYVWACVADSDSGGDITAVNTTAPLSGGGTSGALTLTIGYDNATIGMNGSNQLEVKADGIGTAQIADDAVTTAKILDANVTDAKIASVSVDKITSASGKYFKYMPNAAECADGGVMKWNAIDDQWECGTDTDTNTSAVTTVFGRAGVVTATNGDYTGGQITNVPAGAIAAVTTQAAIDELDAEKLALAGGTLTGAVTTTNSVMFNAQNEARYGDFDSSNYAAIRAPSTIATNYVLTLPDTDGNSGEVLITDGAGVLSWSPASAGDIIGVTTNSGSGLTGGAASGTPVLQVVVDGASIEIATNTIQIKDDGVTTAKILDANVTDAKIASVSVDKIASAVGKYSTYMPNGAECASDGVLKWNNTSDRWECGADNNSPSSGDIDEVIAGTGLTGGATSGAATIAIDFGTGSNQVQQNMDIPHCLSNQKLEMTSGPVYTWSCATDLDSGGDITAVNTTAPLAGGGTTGALTLTIGYDNATIGMNGSNQLEVKPDGIGTTQIADDAITTAKILDANVTDAKIASVSVDKITSASGKYFKYMPNAAECANGGVMKWNATDDQWECGTDTDTNTDAVTTVFGRAGVVTATNGDYTAGQVTNVPAGAVAAVTTQAAIDELDAEKLALTGGTLTGAVSTTSSVTFNAQNEVHFADSDSSSYVAIRAPATVASNYVLTLPDTDGNSGEVLTTDGAGVLSWSPASAGDIVGVTTNSGSGLTGGAASGTPVLQVVVDGASIEIATNTIQIKDDGVTTAKILDANVTDAKIASVSVDKISSAVGKYSSYMPNGAECASDGVLKWNNSSDRWECGADNNTPSSGDIDEVIAGTGLTGGATSGAATLAIDFGTGSNQVQQNMDIPHCLSNQKLEMTSGPVYTWSCTADLDSGGDITAVNTTAPLAGGGTTGALTLTIGYDNTTIGMNGSNQLEVKADGIDTAQIADDAVTTVKILDANVTDAKIASVSVDKITSASGKYFKYMPNAAECADGGVMKWNATDDQWECGTDTDTNTSAVTTVFGRAGVVTATGGDYTAGQITNTPAGSIAAITAQAALNELDTEKLALAGGNLTGAVTTTNSVTFNAQNEAHFADSDSSNYAAIRAPASITSNYVLTLPDTDGGSGEVLTTDGAGVLSWTAAAAGDILGITTNSGSGLTGGLISGTPVLQVVVDNSSIQIATNTIQIKDGGVTTAKILDANVTNAKIVSMTVDKLTSAAGKYFSYMPNAVECSNNGILKWNATDDRWECGAETVSTGDITDVVAGTGLTGGATTGSATLSVDIGTAGTQFQTNSDVDHCTANQKLEMSAGPVYTWSCVNEYTPALIADIDNDTKIQVEESADEDKIRFDTFGSERMIIDNTGKVGIGTSSPVFKLDIGSASSVGSLRVYGTGSDNPSFTIGSSDGSAGVGLEARYRMTLDQAEIFAYNRTTTTYKPILFDASKFVFGTGNVGIGRTSPQALLDVNGIIRATDICDENGSNCKDLSGGWGAGGDIDGITTNTGSALTGGTASGTATISVVTDASTIEVNGSNQLQVKDAGITNAKIVGMAVDKITSASGKYFKYMPNATECANGGVLKWNSTADQWECGTDTDTNTDAISTVFGRTGAVVAVAGDYTATQITNTPAGSIAAITAQAALNELDTEKLALAGGTLTGAVTTTSSVTFNAQNEAHFADSDSSNYAAIRAPASIGTNYVLTLPDTDGGSGEVLTTDGAGVLSWTAAAAGDILGITTSATSGLSGGATSGTPVLQVVVDGSTVQINGSNQVSVKAAGITDTELAANAVTTAKILDANVTNAKIVSMTVDKITSLASKYFSYMPNAVECANDGILKWDATNDHWICGTQSVGTGDITDVVAGTGLTGGATSGSATLNVNIGTATGQLFTIDAVPHCAPNQKIEITSGPVYTFSCVDEYASISLADADNDTKIQVEESADEDIIRFDTFGTERMIIDKSGNVGIGITPTQKLHVNGRIETDGGLLFNQGPLGTDNLMFLGSTTSGAVNASIGFFAAGVGSSNSNDGAYFLARGNTFSDIADQRGNMYFVAGNPTSPTVGENSLNFMTGYDTLRMKIASSGNIGIGTAAPAASLDIGSKNDAIILPKGTTAQQPTAVNGMLRYNTTNSALEYYNGAWRTVSTGAAGAYLSSTGGTLTGLLTISSGGANVTGGVDNNSGGITEAGSITGVGANITGTTALTVAAGGTNQNLTLNASGTGATSIGNTGGTQFQVLNNGASTVNYVTVKGATAGNAPVIGTGGSDTNINLNFTPKGTGNSIFTSGNVGIGTSSPSVMFDVNGASTFRGVLTMNNNAIASADTVSISDFGPGEGFSFASASASNWVMDVTPLDRSNADGNLNLYGVSNNIALWRPTLNVYDATHYTTTTPQAAGGVNVTTTGTGHITFNPGGNVGIGTTAPNEKLVVYGVGPAIRVEDSGTVGNVALLTATAANGPSLTAHTDSSGNSTYNGVSTRLSFSTAGLNVMTSPITAIGAARTFSSQMVVAPSGNVGIGTTNPLYALHAAGAAPVARFQSSSTTGYAAIGAANDNGKAIEMDAYGSAIGGTLFGISRNDMSVLYSNANSLVMGTGSAAPLVFGTQSLERMRIDSSGNVGIGTATPADTLDITGANVAVRIQDTASDDATKVTRLYQKTGTYTGDIIIDVAAASWKSVIYKIHVSAASGNGHFEGMFYNNASISNHNQSINSFSGGVGTIALTIVGAQSYRFTIPLTSVTHPVVEVEIIHGGADAPGFAGDDISFTIN